MMTVLTLFPALCCAILDRQLCSKISCFGFAVAGSIWAHQVRQIAAQIPRAGLPGTAPSRRQMPEARDA